MSMRKAIDDKCRSCIYDDCAPGTWRKQVELCTITECGLYPYRPITEQSRSENASKLGRKKTPQPVWLRKVKQDQTVA